MAYVITKGGAIEVNPNGERPKLEVYNGDGKPTPITDVDPVNGPMVLHSDMYPSKK